MNLQFKRKTNKQKTNPKPYIDYQHINQTVSWYWKRKCLRADCYLNNIILQLPLCTTAVASLIKPLSMQTPWCRFWRVTALLFGFETSSHQQLQARTCWHWSKIWDPGNWFQLWNSLFSTMDNPHARQEKTKPPAVGREHWLVQQPSEPQGNTQFSSGCR